MSDSMHASNTPESRGKRRFVLPAIILLGGLFSAVGLIATRPEPTRVVAPRAAPMVSIVGLEGRTDALFVEGSGTVRPTAQIELSAEVGGRVIAVSPKLARGGSFQRGDTLLVIEPESYRNAVAIARADVRQREVEVALAQQEQVIAREEYRLLRDRTGGLASPDTSLAARLALQQPQLEAAEASLARAEAQLADATLDLRRTVVTAPFTGRVQTESVDVGQYIGPGQSFAELYATESVEVGVSLSTRQASLIDDLWSASPTVRVPAFVRAEFGGVTHEWAGYVDRAAGALDPTTRTVEVVVNVPGAFDGGARPPLLIGSYVRASIEAGGMQRYFALPRPALRDGSTVWVVNADGTLASAGVEVVQEVQDTVFVRSDLAEGSRVVISDLAVMTDGMAVRVEGEPAAATEEISQ